MKLLDKITKKFARNASTAVKKEVKKTAIDLLPTIAAVAAAVAGIFIFKESVSEDRPTLTATHITTNNYFLGDSGEEVIKKILERED